MRSIWTGAISFGLIYIPVKMYNASESQSLDLDMLRKGDLCRIRYARVCQETGEEVPYADIVKGYEYRKGEYVVLTDEDFRRANVKKTQTINIVGFTKAEEIDEKYIEKPYYLEPIKEARKAYALLRDALRTSGEVGIAKFVLRTREYVAMVKPQEEMLLLIQMRYASEIRDPDQLDLPGDENLSARELKMAVSLVNEMTEPWQPEQFHDTYIDDLKRIIREKAEGMPLPPLEEEPVPPETADLFARLNESLKAARERKK